MPNRPKVGQEIELRCGRCKEDRFHTIAALSEEGRIERVVCNFCHTPHKYRDPTPRRKRTPPTPRRTTDLEDGLEDDPGKPGRPYAPSGNYERGDVIEHPKYGRGKVVDVRGDRIDVRFGSGPERVFVHVAAAAPPRATR